MGAFRSEHSLARLRILSVLFMAHGLTAAAMFGFQVLLPQIKASLHFNHAQIGGLMASYFLGISILSLFSGVFADQFGGRRSMVTGSLLVGTTLLIISGLPYVAVMIPALVVSGAGYSLMVPSSNKAVMNWFEGRTRATAMGLKQTGINAGGLLASTLIPFLAVAAGWRQALVVAGLIPVFGAVIIYSFYGHSFESKSAPPRLKSWRGHLGKMVTNRDILLVAVEGFFRTGVQFTFFTYLMMDLERQFKLSLATAGLFYAVAQVGGAGGRIALGLISDRIFGGRRKTVYNLTCLLAMFCFLIFAGFGSASPLWGVFAVVFLLGFAAVGRQGVGLTLMGEVAGAEFTGVASGVCQSLFFIGVVAVTPFVGYVIDVSGGFTYAWILLAAMSLACGVILHFVREPSLEQAEVVPALRRS